MRFIIRPNVFVGSRHTGDTFFESCYFTVCCHSNDRARNGATGCSLVYSVPFFSKPDRAQQSRIPLGPLKWAFHRPGFTNGTKPMTRQRSTRTFHHIRFGPALWHGLHLRPIAGTVRNDEPVPDNYFVTCISVWVGPQVDESSSAFGVPGGQEFRFLSLDYR